MTTAIYRYNLKPDDEPVVEWDYATPIIQWFAKKVFDIYTPLDTCVQIDWNLVEELYSDINSCVAEIITIGSPGMLCESRLEADVYDENYVNCLIDSLPKLARCLIYMQKTGGKYFYTTHCVE